MLLTHILIQAINTQKTPIKPQREFAITQTPFHFINLFNFPLALFSNLLETSQYLNR